MDEKLFEKLGLTKGEIKVYLALIRLGESTIGPITNESKVTKSKIYDILEKLIEKGLVGYIIKSGTKHFVSNDPHMILEYLSKKEDELGKTKKEVIKILPELMSQRNTTSKKRIAEMYEGMQGLKAIREELMQTFKPNESLCVLGAPKIANEKLEGWLLFDFHKKRIKKKINMKIIYDEDAKKYGAEREKMKLTQVRYLKDTSSSISWIDIFPDAVLFAIVLETPIAFVVRDKDLAKSFRTYFEILWKTAKK
jgi:sugar-specific transcriptional regulator TrmB